MHIEWSLKMALQGAICDSIMLNDEKKLKFRIGQVVRHRVYPFRGVVFDVDPEFSNTLLAENEETTYVAYVSEQNLLVDDSGSPVDHPQLCELFGQLEDGVYEVLPQYVH
jgi:heat shock protein HspQ